MQRTARQESQILNQSGDSPKNLKNSEFSFAGGRNGDGEVTDRSKQYKDSDLITIDILNGQLKVHKD